MKKLQNILIITIILFGSCMNNHKNINIDNLLIHEKTYSPDSLNYLIRFSFDDGAFGSCCNQTSILKVSDSLCLINEFIIPSVYDNPKWISDSKLSVEVHMLQLLKRIGNFDPSFPELDINTLNGIVLEKKYFNLLSENDKRDIIFEKSSPDNKYKLIAFEYEPREFLEDSVMHISIIPKGEQIPKYGNLYIVDSQMYNQISSINWIKQDTIEIEISNMNANYGKLDFCVISKTDSYPEIVNNIERKITYIK